MYTPLSIVDTKMEFTKAQKVRMACKPVFLTCQKGCQLERIIVQLYRDNIYPSG